MTAPPPSKRSRRGRPVDSAAAFGDKRGDARAPLGLPSAVQNIGAGHTPASYLACTLDVSPDGARVACAFTPEAGEPVQHVLRLPDDSDPVVVNARVVWVEPENHGGALVGLRYEDNPPHLRRRIERTVDARFQDVRRLQFLLALNSHNTTHQRELKGITNKLGLHLDEDTPELREWAKHAMSLFRHRKVHGTGNRSTKNL